MGQTMSGRANDVCRAVKRDTGRLDWALLCGMAVLGVDVGFDVERGSGASSATASVVVDARSAGIPVVVADNGKTFRVGSATSNGNPDITDSLHVKVFATDDDTTVHLLHRVVPHGGRESVFRLVMAMFDAAQTLAPDVKLNVTARQHVLDGDDAKLAVSGFRLSASDAPQVRATVEAIVNSAMFDLADIARLSPQQTAKNNAQLLSAVRNAFSHPSR